MPVFAARSMTDTRSPTTSGPSSEAVLRALRQAGLMAVALLVGGMVTERLRPEDALDRGIASTPFLWAIVVWAVVLVLDVVAFEESQMPSLERMPLYASVGIGALTFVVGLVSYDAGSFGRRVVYLFANSLGAAVFWWAVIGLAVLSARRLAL